MIQRTSQYWIEDPLRDIKQPTQFIIRGSSVNSLAGVEGLGISFVRNVRLLNTNNLPLFQYTTTTGSGTQLSYSRIYDRESVIVNVPGVVSKIIVIEEEYTTTITKLVPAFELSDSSGNMVGLAICNSGYWQNAGWDIVEYNGAELDPFEYGHWTVYYTTKPFSGDLEDKTIKTSNRSIYDVAPCGYHNKIFQITYSHAEFAPDLIYIDWYCAIVSEYEDDNSLEPSYSSIPSRSRGMTLYTSNIDPPPVYLVPGHGSITLSASNVSSILMATSYNDYGTITIGEFWTSGPLPILNAFSSCVMDTDNYTALYYTIEYYGVGETVLEYSSYPYTYVTVNGTNYQISPRDGIATYNWISYIDPEFGTIAKTAPFESNKVNVRYYKHEGKTYILYAIPDKVTTPVGDTILNTKIRYLFMCPEDGIIDFNISFEQFRDGSNNPYHMVENYYCFMKFRLVRITEIEKHKDERKVRR